jgi:Tfp pilus assembly protein PilV
MLTRAFRDERGITLAEILVATVVISIGLVGLAMVIPLSSYGVHEGNALSTATFLAEQKLEEIRNASWTSVPTEGDCLGLGSAAAPTSNTCARTQPTVCTSGVACTTFADEASVTGYPQYTRSARASATPTCASCA